MLLTIFLGLGTLTVILMLLCIYWDSITLCSVDIILWLTLSISVYNIEIPYQYTVGGEVFTSTQVIQNLYPLSWLFILMAFIMMFYLFFTMIFPMLKQKFSKVM